MLLIQAFLFADGQFIVVEETNDVIHDPEQDNQQQSKHWQESYIIERSVIFWTFVFALHISKIIAMISAWKNRNVNKTL